MLRRRVAKAGYAIGDQAVSSLTNVAGNIAVATTASAADYGAFGVSLAVLLTLSAVLSGLVIEPLLVRHRTDPRSAGRAVWYCALAGLPATALALLLLPRVPPTALPVLVTMPLLLGLDGLRFFLLGSSRAKRALGLDTIWLVGVAGWLAIAASVGQLGPVTAAWGYALSGCLALLVGVVKDGMWRPEWGLPAFVVREREIALPWGLEHLAGKGVFQALTFLVAGAYGLAGAGAFRGALTLLGPLTVLTAGLRFAALPYFLEAGREGVVRRAAWLSGVFVLASLLVGAPLLALPTSLGTWLLGDSWQGARLVLPYLILYRAISAANVGPAIGLRVSEVGYASLLLRLLTGASLLAAGGLAIAVGAPLELMVLALVVASCLSLPFWFVRIRKEG